MRKTYGPKRMQQESGKGSIVVLLTKCNHSAETEKDKTGGA